MNFPDLTISSAGKLNQVLIFPGYHFSVRRANSHLGSSQRAPALCTGCTAPTSTCSITHSLGQGFGADNFSGLIKSYFIGSSDKFFPQVQVQGETCSSELALLMAKSGRLHVPKTQGRWFILAQCISLRQNHFLLQHFNANVKAKSICLLFATISVSPAHAGTWIKCFKSPQSLHHQFLSPKGSPARFAPA